MSAIDAVGPEFDRLYNARPSQYARVRVASMIENETVEAFLDQLASKSSTPGGGSAAGIMGAMGAALVSMVCNLTIGKEKYREVEAEMQSLLAAAEDLRRRLTELINTDVQAFDQVMSAHGMPRENDAQKAQRGAAIQTALKAATEVPLQCARACVQVIDLSRAAAAKGNANVISDAGVAVMAAFGGLRSAALNVHINAGTIEDEAFVAASRAEIERLVAHGDTAMNSIYELVKSKL